MTPRPTIIRANFGSRRTVTRVFWFDPDAGSVGVQFDDGRCAEMSADELEAVRGKYYVPLFDLLRERAAVRS
jgi:hypothetical protein